MNDLEALKLHAGATLRDAMMQLDHNRTGMAMVVDDQGRLVGTVTDGDIRRAILGRKTLESDVTQLMCRSPVTAPVTTSEAELLSLMNLHRIRHIPIVDDAGCPIRLCQMSDLLEATKKPSPIAVIMAGGEGRRLGPLTETVPKPLVKVGSASILENLIADVAKAGVKQVYVSVNYKADVIQEYVNSRPNLPVSVSFLREETKMGTAGALSLLKETPKGPILVINGDIITTVNIGHILDYHSRHRSVLTVAVVEYVFRVPYGVLETAGHYVLGITEKPSKGFLCNAGIYILEPEIIRLARPHIPMDMTELMLAVLSEGLPVCVFPILEKWIDIGNPEDLDRARREFAAGGQ